MAGTLHDTLPDPQGETSEASWGRGATTGTLAQAHLTAAARCPACAGTWQPFVLPDPTERPQVSSPEAAADVLLPALYGRDRERCVAALLDTKHRLLRTAVVSVGSIDHTFMAPREVYRDALLANASAIVLAHNHPSGDREPSRDDEVLTGRLARAGEIVGVDLLDHLVVGGAGWVSLARRGQV